MLYHMVSKNSISASVGMQQKYLINGIQRMGVSRSFSLTFSSCAPVLYVYGFFNETYVL